MHLRTFRAPFLETDDFCRQQSNDQLISTLFVDSSTCFTLTVFSLYSAKALVTVTQGKSKLKIKIFR